MSFSMARKFLDTLSDPSTIILDTPAHRAYIVDTMNVCDAVAMEMVRNGMSDMARVLQDRIDVVLARYPWI